MPIVKAVEVIGIYCQMVARIIAWWYARGTYRYWYSWTPNRGLVRPARRPASSYSLLVRSGRIASSAKQRLPIAFLAGAVSPHCRQRVGKMLSTSTLSGGCCGWTGTAVHGRCTSRPAASASTCKLQISAHAEHLSFFGRRPDRRRGLEIACLAGNRTRIRIGDDDLATSKQSLRSSGVRINKCLRHIASRRETDRFVETGRIQINGKTATHGDRVSPGDVIELDGQRVDWEKLNVFGKPAL
eukprot:scaffold155916_cov31-Prasinocladus_malaysianus.AAC.3